MNPFALAFVVTASLCVLSLIAGAFAVAIEAILKPSGRTLIYAVVFASGFCAGVGAFFVRT